MNFSDSGILKTLLNYYIGEIMTNETKFITRFAPGFENASILDVNFSYHRVNVEIYPKRGKPIQIVCEYDAVTRWIDNNASY